ncbi:hypothetical protein OV207_29075 [Corallococcus sp. BB11-1]|uniref:hypothetical protein n=1 Tax=Corallococcus sp. BB11-1 TaxID=2996783 RepID=UPI00226F21D0|nr:hypothetical protein [Corallococcus sp. BB11-1]MCY1035528.1 hypothetical protein [Corallococcus sp. BB11-1]
MRHSLTPWHGLFTGLAALHMLLVACGALRIPVVTSAPDAVRPWAKGYTHWTGASSGYSFFAPGVSPAVRVSFELEHPSGERLRDDFEFDDSAVNVRIHSMLLRFGIEKSRDALARAWAATMFGRHPEARSVTVRVDTLHIPRMGEHHDGERPFWSEGYRAVFERRAPAASSVGAVAP